MRFMMLGMSLFLSHCAATNKDNRSPSDAPSPKTSTFADKINPIITKSCSGASCHSSSSLISPFVGNETLFRSKATDIASRLDRSDSSKMPPANAGRTLVATDKATILKYFNDEGLVKTNATPSSNSSTNSGSNTTTPSSSTSTTNTNDGSALSYECRSGITIDTNGTKPDFMGAINPVLVASCSGSTCHSNPGNGRKMFVGSESTFRETDTAILNKLKNNLMPIGGSTIAQSDKQLIYQYLCSSGS